MTGGPQNLYNLLSQFPPNSYCILTSYEAILRRTSGGKWLGGEYIFYDHAGRFARRPSTQSHGTHLPSRGYASLFEAVEKLPRIVRYWVSVILQAVYLLRSISRIVRTGVPIVRQKKIDCVMGISDVGTALISSYVISSHKSSICRLLVRHIRWESSNSFERLIRKDIRASHFQARLTRYRDERGY